MSLVYDQLQKSENFAAIDLKGYIASLSQKLHRAVASKPSSRIRIVMDCDSILVSLTQAVPIGLVLNEIISNALQHAFPDKRSGEITVIAKLDKPGRLKMVLSDNGVGFPPGLFNGTNDSLGLRIINMLVGDQLSGEHSIQSEHGVSHIIAFELLSQT
jgi:two-component system, sensor histidine kinase PdtaS